MKVKIERTFVDKYTQERREAGSIVDFDEKRAAELLADPRHVVSAIEGEEEPKKPAAKKAAPKKKTTKK